MGNGSITMAGAFALAIGIAIQNFPEGAIISMPLKSNGTSKLKAFSLGAMSGLVEPIAVLITLEGASEEVAKEVAMHAAAMRPSYIRREDVPAEETEKEMAVLKEQAMNEGKPAEIAEKMVAGRINKFYKEICLTKQAFIKDGDIDVETYVKNNKGSIKTMVRYEVGEGMQKREDNFAEEVMNQVNGTN